jgi:hypothetical protein
MSGLPMKLRWRSRRASEEAKEDSRQVVPVHGAPLDLFRRGRRCAHHDACVLTCVAQRRIGHVLVVVTARTCGDEQQRSDGVRERRCDHPVT